MGTRYTTNSASGYNSVPPADDGTVSESNKTKYSTIKTKLSDPVKTLADTINSELVTHFDNGPTALTVSTTLGLAHYNQVAQVSGASVTLTLTDASTLGAGWYCDIVSTDASNSVTLARATASNTINETSSDITILPLQALHVIVNAAANGFLVDLKPRHSMAFQLAGEITGFRGVTTSIAYGTNALASNTTGANNIAVGTAALGANTTANNNTAVGYNALGSNTTAANNTAVGYNALAANTTGNNVAVGQDALAANTTASYNTAVGTVALSTNTTGGSNTAVGHGALANNTTANNNTAVGYGALDANTTGADNTAMGHNALGANTTSSNNTAVGQDALAANTGGSNTAVGTNALIANTIGGTNTAVGQNALVANTTGADNTAVGAEAGNNITTGSNCQVFGRGATASSATATNEVTLGNVSIATLRCAATTITGLSDKKDKTDIEDIPLGLDFINVIQPRRFTWNTRDGAKVGVMDSGFIAQELQTAQAKFDADWLGLVFSENPEKLEATPGKLLPVLVKAIQELSARNALLEARLNAAGL